MNKTWIIIKREYLSRVRKKSFILSTLLMPLAFVGLFAGIIFITVKNTRKENIAVIDPSGYLKANLESSRTVSYDFRSDVDTGNFVQKGFSAILFAPNTGINQSKDFKLITARSINEIANSKIEKDISRALENNLISQELKIDPKRIDSIKNRADEVEIVTTKRGETGDLKESNQGLARGLGYASGFLIYLTLFIYGSMVMRGVMEEKTNRIAEVVVSSVRPVQLMLGKIIGIGAVGLTQLLMWMVLLFVLSGVVGALVPAEALAQAQDAQQQIPGQAAQTSAAMRGLAAASNTLSTVNWPLLVFCFAFYFLGGYLFYAALFAAVGSAVNEDPQDAQSLMLPITMPIVLGIIIMINALSDPSSSLATWSSIIPFFSPIVMMARIPFGVPDTVPYWQLLLSMALLVGGFLATTWLSAKIYRTGILMYGKKPTWKELVKWMRQG